MCKIWVILSPNIAGAAGKVAGKWLEVRHRRSLFSRDNLCDNFHWGEMLELHVAWGEMLELHVACELSACEYMFGLDLSPSSGKETASLPLL